MDLQYIAELVAKSVFGDRNANLLTHKEIQTPSSRVFRLEYAVDGASRALFVKIPADDIAHSATVIQRLRHEYAVTARIKPAFKADPALRTIAPAGFIDQINGLVTWEVKGNSLQDHISARLRFRYRQEVPELERLSKLSGEWLRHFHSLDMAEGNPDLRQIISGYCEDRLEVLSRTRNSRISEELADSLKQNISQWIDEALSSRGAKTILCHNDFSPHNIIVTDEGICVLDFSFSTPGLPAFDLACFWHKLEDLKGSLLRGNRGLRVIQDRFLDAYGTDFDTARPDVKLGLARLILSKMLVLLNSRSGRSYRWLENQRRYSAYLAQLESGFELTRR
jgi:aminoglycoside phosphotransferase (APT) family kinase protein